MPRLALAIEDGRAHASATLKTYPCVRPSTRFRRQPQYTNGPRMPTLKVFRAPLSAAIG